MELHEARNSSIINIGEKAFKNAWGAVVVSYYFRYQWWPEAQRQIPRTAALEPSIRRLNLTVSYKYGELLPRSQSCIYRQQSSELSYLAVVAIR